jgi:hypothetical protein
MTSFSPANSLGKKLFDGVTKDSAHGQITLC